MSHASDLAAAGVALVFELVTTESVAWAQGANTKSGLTGAIVSPSVRVPSPDGPDEEERRWLFLVADFASGFSSPTSITPSPGDLLTPSGGDPFKVADASLVGQGVAWEITARRTIQRGS